MKSQEFLFSGNRDRQSIGFKNIKNLVIIPVMINEKGPFDFVLDTGVGPMIVTDSSIIDNLNFALLRRINVSGLGAEALEAYVSNDINAQVGNAKIENIPTAILKEDLFNLSGYLGVKIYGLIGYHFFNSFMVDIRYSASRIIFSSPHAKLRYRGSKIPIEIDKLKPYVYAQVETPQGNKVKSKFLMDTGASHALSMEMLDGKAFPLPVKTISASLGMSLSGKIKGHLGRIAKINLGHFTFKNVLSGFPDFETISGKIDLKFRNGNIGAEILKKFDIQLNYQEGFMYLKPNQYHKQPFEHDMTGLTVYIDQAGFKRIIIAEIDENSPAEKAGLCPDDEIIGVNFKPVEFYTLNDLSELFKSKSDRTIVFEIVRADKVYFKIVTLEKRI
ncbi:aspartyl protease family protein [Pedobacter sp. BMA]|uniref:aspartyl protease family protein n=1 Tax=Pedobacter sp. BMA TaxID=1663685 RepID=UPI00069D3AFC|nr:aspartyl protease family protein [Pedobacter sp. BMA]